MKERVAASRARAVDGPERKETPIAEVGHPMLGLQRVLGNQAVGRLLNGPRRGRIISRAELTGGPSGSLLEAEAKHTGEHVMRRAEPALAGREPVSASAAGTRLQRKEVQVRPEGKLQNPREPTREELNTYVCDPKQALKIHVYSAIRTETEQDNLAAARVMLGMHGIELEVVSDVASSAGRDFPLGTGIYPNAFIDSACSACRIISHTLEDSPRRPGHLPVFFLALEERMGSDEVPYGLTVDKPNEFCAHCHPAPTVAAVPVVLVDVLRAYNTTLTHEIGHAVGASHFPGTFMSRGTNIALDDILHFHRLHADLRQKRAQTERSMGAAERQRVDREIAMLELKISRSTILPWQLKQLCNATF